MKVYHLSHTDLDGYGCQFVSREFFSDINFYNANYGREVLFRINQILDAISGSESRIDTDSANFGKSVSGGFGVLADKLKGLKSAAPTPKKPVLILISDLNLTLSEATFLNTRVNEINAAGSVAAEVLVLDHHITGADCAKKFNWYHLDESRCATKIVFEYLSERFGIRVDSRFGKRTEILKNIVEMINSVDIWKEDGYKFEFGKVAMGVVAGSNELNKVMFDAAHREYKFALMESFAEFLGKENDAVEFDNAVFGLKKRALGGDPARQTMDAIIANRQVELLGEMLEAGSIEIDGYKGFLSYFMGGISVLGNLFLRTHGDFAFYMDVNGRGNVSLRAADGCDVSALSAKYFNGGGHKNASGGKIENFRECFTYADVKEQVLGFINSKR